MSSKVASVVGLSDADAAALASIAHQVDTAQAELAAAQARLVRALARAEELACRMSDGQSRSARGADMAHRAIASELAVPLRISDRTMQRRMVEAAELVTSYPATVDAWEAGHITQAHVRVISESGGGLPAHTRAEFEQHALVRCEEDTAGRVRTSVQMIAERLHPRTLTERHRDAAEKRAVTVQPLDDGMCELTATIPLVLGDAIHDRLTRMATVIHDARGGAAQRLRAGGVGGDEIIASDTRTMDQVRADVLTDLLLSAAPTADPTASGDQPGSLGAIRAHVQVVVPALTLLHASEHPADLAGRAPIDAETARLLAGFAPGWDRLLTHPVSGQVLATDRYQPTPDLRRRLRARDAHCRFPGCRVPAIRHEHDHTHDHALGGHTTLENLEGLCQRHHSMKQFTGWRVKQIHAGVLAWTSPLGYTYIDEPPSPSVHFIPEFGPPEPEDPPAGAPPPF